MHHLLTWLLGPMLAKELVELSRRWRYYLARLVVGSGLLGVVLVVCSQREFSVAAEVSTVGELAELGHTLFFGLAWLQFAAVFALLPPMLSGVISAEREAHTLDLLFTTQLTNREIVWGKFGSRMLVAGLTIFSVVPVLMIVLTLGGVDLGELLMAAAATLLAVLFVSGQAVHASAVCRTPLSAILRTYWFLAFWIVVVPVIAGIIVNLFDIGRHDPGSEIVYAAMMINPVAVFGGAIERDFYGEFYGQGSWNYPVAFALLGCWSVILLGRSVQLLRGVDTRPPVGGRRRWRMPPWPVPRRALRWLADRHRVGFMSRFMPRNPLVWRASRSLPYDREGYVVALHGCLIVGCLLFGLVVASHVLTLKGWPDLIVWQLVAVLAWSMVGFLAVSVAAGSLASDRRRGLLDLLLATPLTARELFDGTVGAVIQHVWVGWIGMALITGVGTIGIHASRLMSAWAYGFRASEAILDRLVCGFLLSWICGLAIALYLVVAGVACSAPARTWSQALAPGMVLLALEAFGLHLLMMFTTSVRPETLVVLTVGLTATWFIRHRALNHPLGLAVRIGALRWLLLICLFDPYGTVAPQFDWPESGLVAAPISYVVLLPQQLYGGWYGNYVSVQWTDVAKFLAATVVTTLLVRWGAIRRFDLLLGRATTAPRVHPAGTAKPALAVSP